MIWKPIFVYKVTALGFFFCTVNVITGGPTTRAKFYGV